MIWTSPKFSRRTVICSSTEARKSAFEIPFLEQIPVILIMAIFIESFTFFQLYQVKDIIDPLICYCVCEDETDFRGGHPSVLR